MQRGFCVGTSNWLRAVQWFTMEWAKPKCTNSTAVMLGCLRGKKTSLWSDWSQVDADFWHRYETCTEKALLSQTQQTFRVGPNGTRSEFLMRFTLFTHLEHIVHRTYLGHIAKAHCEFSCNATFFWGKTEKCDGKCHLWRVDAWRRWQSANTVKFAWRVQKSIPPESVSEKRKTLFFCQMCAVTFVCGALKIYHCGLSTVDKQICFGSLRSCGPLLSFARGVGGSDQAVRGAWRIHEKKINTLCWFTRHLFSIYEPGGSPSIESPTQQLTLHSQSFCYLPWFFACRKTFHQ